MAKSPFPGMDPFLEVDWLDVHSALVTYLRDQIQDQLPKDLCARMESRVVVARGAGIEPRERHPDVHVAEARGSGGGTAVLELPLVSTIEPDLFLIDARSEPATQRYVEIVDSRTRSKVITTIELVSPSNKLPGPGRKQYLDKRNDCLLAGVNVVEVDLTRRGDRLSILEGLDQLYPQPTYLAWVHRATDPDQVAVYRLPLDQPLKPIRIPLRPTDEDVVLHLQPLVAQAYERGRYENLDYGQLLQTIHPPFTREELAFVEQVLKPSGK